MSSYDEAGKKKLQEEVQKTDFPLIFTFIEKHLEENVNKDFLVGCKYTVADFHMLGMYVGIQSQEPGAKLWNECTLIPLLKAYIAKRLKDFENYYKKPCTKPKFYYFDGPGRGEMVRLLLRHAKVDFEDVRIKYTDWGTMKGQFALKQVPVWECCGVQMPQNDAIMHHLSLKHGYLPLDAEKMYKVLFISNTVKDLFEGFVKYFYGGFPEDVKKKKEEEYFTKTVPLIFEILEKRLKENESQMFFVGNQYTMADFYFLGAARWLVINPQTEKSYEKALTSAPLLKAFLKKRLEDFA
jgi:glutathione S-transferase